MGWVRAHRTWGGLLALFALTVQLVLSFGHIHADEIAGRPEALAAISQPATPHDDAPGQDHDDDKFCGICAVLHLLSVAHAVAPPALPLPVAFRAAPRLTGSESLVATFHHAAFRSRAPPTA